VQKKVIQLESSNSIKTEIIRKKYLYRKLIQTGKIIVPRKAAVSLVGPDCVYHIYSVKKEKEKGLLNSNI